MTKQRPMMPPERKKMNRFGFDSNGIQSMNKPMKIQIQSFDESDEKSDAMENEREHSFGCSIEQI